MTAAAHTPLRALSATTILLAAVATFGCGGGDRTSSGTSTTQHPKGGYLAGSDLERQLGNAFRTGLYRLSVRTQRSEDAKDLGQPLPTGLLNRVHCTSSASAPSSGQQWMWSCGVGWRSVEGQRQQTQYTVRLSPGRCFAAGATPQRKPRYDATIRTYSADPLNALVSVQPGC